MPFEVFCYIASRLCLPLINILVRRCKISFLRRTLLQHAKLTTFSLRTCAARKRADLTLERDNWMSYFSFEWTCLLRKAYTFGVSLPYTCYIAQKSNNIRELHWHLGLRIHRDYVSDDTSRTRLLGRSFRLQRGRDSASKCWLCY